MVEGKFDPEIKLRLIYTLGFQVSTNSQKNTMNYEP